LVWLDFGLSDGVGENRGHMLHERAGMRTVATILGGWALLLVVPVNVGTTVSILGIIPGLWEIIAGVISLGLFLWILVRDRSAIWDFIAGQPDCFAIWTGVAWGTAGAVKSFVTSLQLSGRVDRVAIVSALLSAVLLGTTSFVGVRVIAGRI
jgi:hypothetical protein